jgi:pimeloyl-ACP methyl ester carboxylesterase
MNDRATWRDPGLGPARELKLSTATIRVHERGSGHPLVFVHGLLVNANLWRKVVPRLADDYRCICLDLPLGSQTIPTPDQDMTLPGLADLIAEALEALELNGATVIANDTGGAITQVLMTRHPERIGSVVLTSCDCFDNFLPPTFMPMVHGAKVVPGFVAILANALRPRPLRRLPNAFGRLSKKVPENAASDSFVLPAATDGGVRAGVTRLLKGVDKRYTEEAATKLPAFDKPVLVAWSRDDRFFPPAYGERLAGLFPDGRLEWIDDSYTFSMEDQPERLADLIGAFAREPVKEMTT